MAFKKDFFNRIFIIVSLVNFVLLFALFSFLSRLDIGQEKIVDSAAADDLGAEGVYSESNDPFITPGPGAEKLLLSPILDGRDPQLGPDDAKVTIVEFSDFSCQFCSQQEVVIKEVLDRYKDRVRLIWKDFPGQDDLSYQASLAARCADEQGKFWPVHDLFFSRGEDIFSTPLSEIANQFGMEAAKFEACFLQKKFDSDIKRNLKEAAALRLPGVPFFFINGQEYLGGIDKEDLERIINEQ
jgi:protein-disulfide isomerase